MILSTTMAMVLRYCVKRLVNFEHYPFGEDNDLIHFRFAAEGARHRRGRSLLGHGLPAHRERHPGESAARPPDSPFLRHSDQVRWPKNNWLHGLFL